MRICKFPFASQAGFTILELLIAFSVGTILTLVGIASFVAYNKIQVLNTSALDIATFVSSARSRAQSQVLPPGLVCSGKSLNGYRVTFCGLGGSGCVGPHKTDTKYFELQASCGVSYYMVNEKSLSKTLSFDSCSNAASFDFPVVSGGSNEGTIGIVDGSGTRRVIHVDAGGNVNANASSCP